MDIPNSLMEDLITLRNIFGIVEKQHQISKNRRTEEKPDGQ